MFGTPKASVSDEARVWLENGFERLMILWGEEWLTTAPVVLPTRVFSR